MKVVQASINRKKSKKVRGDKRVKYWCSGTDTRRTIFIMDDDNDDNRDDEDMDMDSHYRSL
jgi:hypothetical protein